MSEFYYIDNDDANFFAFYNDEEFVGFAFSIYNQKAFMSVSFVIMPYIFIVWYGQKSLKIAEFTKRTMILEVERLDECDNIEQRQSRMIL